MYIKRFLLVAIASVMSLGFLGACGGSAPTSTEDDTPTEEVSTDEAEEGTETDETEEGAAESE